MLHLRETAINKRDEHGVRRMGAYAKKYSKMDSSHGEMADLGALLEVSIEQIGKRETGRPPTYADNEEGLREFLEATRQYFEYIRDANAVNEEKLIPDIEGWSIFIGITRQTVSTYAKRSDTWRETIDYIKDSILASKKQMAFRFKIPPVVYLNDVSNNHGYLNTSEFKITAEAGKIGQVPTMSREEIAARHASYIGIEEPEKPDLDF